MPGSIIPAGDVTASALHAERTRLEVIAQNIANMNTTRDVNGEPYRRKAVVFESVMNDAMNGGSAQVRVKEIKADDRPLPQVYMPGHPDANEDGMVTMPNVNVIEEMADMLTASRAFEANLQVLRTSRQMLRESIEIGISR